MRATVYGECIYVFLSKSCPHLWISIIIMLIVDKHHSDICCDEFLVPHIDHKSKQKISDMRNFICNQYGENLLFQTPKISKFVDE